MVQTEDLSGILTVPFLFFIGLILLQNLLHVCADCQQFLHIILSSGDNLFKLTLPILSVFIPSYPKSIFPPGKSAYGNFLYHYMSLEAFLQEYSLLKDKSILARLVTM